MHTEMIIRVLFTVTLAVAAAAIPRSGHSTEQPPSPAPSPVSQAAEATYQVDADLLRNDWRMDPAMFTDISPVNAPDIAIRLPEDQREE
ncbi:MAG: hypothetical protein O7B25_08935 [Gammaproteobacteria bacterium]|nr:hypothetical protein [Gammaproteobacteria bacterium]